MSPTPELGGHCQHREVPHRKAFSRLVAAGVVAEGVAAVQPGGVERQLGLLADQAAPAGAAEDLSLQEGEPLFCSSRFWAYQSVEWSGTLVRPRSPRSAGKSCRKATTPR